MDRGAWAWLLSALLGACAGGEAPASARVTISIVGTSDLHGHVRALPLLAGHLAGLRSERVADGGAVLLVDAGDLFQGTLESTLEEGARQKVRT